MKKMIITINMDNAAFQEGKGNYETARILRKLADDIEEFTLAEKIKDINGNTVGKVEYK